MPNVYKISRKPSKKSLSINDLRLLLLCSNLYALKHGLAVTTEVLLSPFAIALKQLRTAAGMPQHELARLIGCERSYLAGLEIDLRGLPSPELINAIGRALQLVPSTLDKLHKTASVSLRRFTLSRECSPETFMLVHELFEASEQLSSLQIETLRNILKLGIGAPANHDGRVRRSDCGSPRSKGSFM